MPQKACPCEPEPALGDVCVPLTAASCGDLGLIRSLSCSPTYWWHVPQHTHTDEDTHTQIHTDTDAAETQRGTCTHSHACLYADKPGTGAHTHTRTHALVHAHTTHIYLYTHTHACAYTQRHSHVCTQRNIHTCVHTCAHVHAHSQPPLSGSPSCSRAEKPHILATSTRHTPCRLSLPVECPELGCKHSLAQS